MQDRRRLRPCRGLPPLRALGLLLYGAEAAGRHGERCRGLNVKQRRDRTSLRCVSLVLIPLRNLHVVLFCLYNSSLHIQLLSSLYNSCEYTSKRGPKTRQLNVRRRTLLYFIKVVGLIISQLHADKL